MVGCSIYRVAPGLDCDAAKERREVKAGGEKVGAAVHERIRVRAQPQRNGLVLGQEDASGRRLDQVAGKGDEWQVIAWLGGKEIGKHVKDVVAHLLRH